MVWACETFHMYLFGTDFDLVTDHKPLEFIFSTKSKPCARVERCVLRLQQYNYKVQHIPGPNNIADSLSRLVRKSPPGKSETNDIESYVKFVAQEAKPIAMITREIARESASDADPEDIRKCLLSGRWYELKLREFLPVRHELCAIIGIARYSNCNTNCVERARVGNRA